MLNLNTIARATMESIPYCWVQFENLIPKSQLKELLNTFPHENFGGKPVIIVWQAEELPDCPVNPFYASTNLSLVWQTLVDQLHSSAYRSALGKLTGLNLDQHLIRIYLSRFDSSTPGSRPHTDTPGITLTHLFYFNEDWDTEWGGSFQVLKDEQTSSVVRDILPLIGNSVVLVRSDHSWHTISPISPIASQHRLRLMVRFYEQPFD